MKILTWQNPGQLFVAQALINNVKYSVAELRIMRFSGKNSMTILFGDIQNVKSIVYLLAKPVYHIKGYINW